MNVLDLVIVAAMAAAAAGGWRLGFLARVVSWAGLALGLVIAARFLPAAVRSFQGPDPSSKLLIAAVVLLGGAFVGQGIGLLAGSSLRRFVPTGPLQLIDSAVGAAIGALGVVVAVWLLLPAIGDVPGAMAREARTSVLARAIDRQLPAPPDTLQALRRVVGDTNFPRVFEALRPAPDTGPPPATAGISDAVLNRVAASTVKVSGEACRRTQEGSGFSVAPDTIVTNAHVVAGQRPGATQVLRPDGRRLRATVVAFDPGRDLAVLSVPGLGQAPLDIDGGGPGSRGAVFGHPNGQDQLRIAPAAIRQKVDAVGRDLYDSRPTRREVFILAAALQPGDSGAALVNPAGDVMGVAFAIAPDQGGTAYAVTTKELRAVLGAQRAPVSAGPCLTSG